MWDFLSEHAWLFVVIALVLIAVIWLAIAWFLGWHRDRWVPNPNFWQLQLERQGRRKRVLENVCAVLALTGFGILYFIMPLPGLTLLFKHYPLSAAWCIGLAIVTGTACSVLAWRAAHQLGKLAAGMRAAACFCVGMWTIGFAFGMIFTPRPM